jgi:hypothetical protein
MFRTALFPFLLSFTFNHIEFHTLMKTRITHLCLPLLFALAAGCAGTDREKQSSEGSSRDPIVRHPASHWAAVANSTNRSDAARRHAVFTLLRSYTRSGMTMYDLRALLSNPTWLTSRDIIWVAAVTGYIPVDSDPHDTVFAFTVLPQSEYHKSAVYFRVSGKVPRAAVEKCLLGDDPKNCREIVIEQWGFAEQQNER